MGAVLSEGVRGRGVRGVRVWRIVLDVAEVSFVQSTEHDKAVAQLIEMLRLLSGVLLEDILDCEWMERKNLDSMMRRGR